MSADTTERLRADIDSGRTGDKIPWPDPAAAPLGADEEAAGVPVAPHAVRQAREQEISHAPQAAPSRPHLVWFTVVAFAVVATGAAVYGLRGWFGL